VQQWVEIRRRRRPATTLTNFRRIKSQQKSQADF